MSACCSIFFSLLLHKNIGICVFLVSLVNIFIFIHTCHFMLLYSWNDSIQDCWDWLPQSAILCWLPISLSVFFLAHVCHVTTQFHEESEMKKKCMVLRSWNANRQTNTVISDKMRKLHTCMRHHTIFCVYEQELIENILKYWLGKCTDR